MSKLPDFFGKFPFPAHEKQPAMIRKGDMRPFIYPLDKRANSDINWLIASTDRIFSAIYQIPPGGTFEPPDIHDGDEPYYILKGTLTMTNPETEQVVQIREGESLLIPKGAWHKDYNFGDTQLTILVMIAPRIWGPEGPPK